MPEPSPEQLDSFFNILNFDDVRVIVWDLDQVLSNSEAPVKQAFFEETGFDYRDKLVDRWRALAHWTFEAGLMPLAEAEDIEARLWRNTSILGKAPPNKEMIEYSKKAFTKGIKQFIVTSRPGDDDHYEATIRWRNEHCSWIPATHIRIRDKNDKMDGGTFKAEIIASIQPDVMFEDSPAHVKEVLKGIENIRIVLFARGAERGMVNDERVIEVPNMQVFGEAYRLFHKKLY